MENTAQKSDVNYKQEVGVEADVTYIHTGACFKPTKTNFPNLKKGDKDQLSVLNDSTEVLTLAYVVESAKRIDSVPVQIGNVTPFQQMQVIIDPGKTLVLKLRLEMGLGERGTIVGALNPEGGCPHGVVALSHTEWHIEC